MGFTARPVPGLVASSHKSMSAGIRRETLKACGSAGKPVTPAGGHASAKKILMRMHNLSLEMVHRWLAFCP